MENRLKDAFDSLHMPQSCADRIERKLCKPMKKQKEYYAEPAQWEVDGWVKGIAVAAVMLGLIAGGILLLPGSDNTAVDPTEITETTTDARDEALEEHGETLMYAEAELEQIKAELGEIQAALDLARNDPNLVDTIPAELRALLESDRLDEIQAGLEIIEAAKADIKDGLAYVENDIKYTYRGWGNTLQIHEAYNAALSSPWTKTMRLDNLVFFEANGEWINISDLFSEEEPFVYIYTDRYYVTHYIAIGGTVENMGYLEARKFCTCTELEDGNLGGMFANTWNGETESRYGWEQRAKEIFEPYGVYWVS